jgi:hypothetical protein
MPSRSLASAFLVLAQLASYSREIELVRHRQHNILHIFAIDVSKLSLEFKLLFSRYINLLSSELFAETAALRKLFQQALISLRQNSLREEENPCA